MCHVAARRAALERREQIDELLQLHVRIEREPDHALARVGGRDVVEAALERGTAFCGLA